MRTGRPPRLLAALWLACCLAPPSRAAELPKAVMVVEEGDAVGRSLARLIYERLKGRVDFRWIPYSAEKLGNPIYKGKLLAPLATARLVVTAGDESTGLALSELEDTPVYFVGASLVPGASMAFPQVAGLLNYSADDVMAAVPQGWKQGLGLLYSPGYEKVLESIRLSAQAAGVTLIERRVSTRRELPPAARALIDRARAVWILGDPLFIRGPGLEFLAEESLAQGVPLVGSGAWEVRHGAVFCSQAAQRAVAEAAAKNIAAFLESSPGAGRVESAPAGGRILFHRGLAARYGLTPRAPQWLELR